MAQVTLPQSIDAGTAIVASEVQSNFVALRDAINGDLEGGSSGNLKSNGVTAREVLDAVLQNAGANNGLQEGVYGSGDGKVTPGANLILNYAAGGAFIDDDAGIIGTGVRVPANWSGSSVTIAANASGNPRIDQVILTLTGWQVGTVSVLQGTATAGATLANRTGAAALPAGAIRLADILMPNGFAGPFVQTTHIRDRRPWARGAYVVTTSPDGADYTNTNGAWTAIASADLDTRVELSGLPVIVTLYAEVSISGGAAARVGVGDGVAGSGFTARQNDGTTASRHPITVVGYTPTPSAGSHLFVPSSSVFSGAGTHTIHRSTGGGTQPGVVMVIQEDLRANAGNTGA